MALSEKNTPGQPQLNNINTAGEEEPLRCPFKVGLTPSPPPGSTSIISSPSTDQAPRRRSTHYEDSQGSTGLDESVQNDSRSDHVPQDVINTLPTFYHEGKDQEVLKVLDNLELYLDKDLELKRLNQIHGKLWMCGRPFNARALHRQILMGRRLFITEQADLHLLHHSDIIMLKPLPAYILCPQVWVSYFNQKPELHKSAAGLLISYVWLVRSPADFKIAIDKERPLFPPGMTWELWKRIVDETISYINPNSLHQVNQRYQFGELRLGRINTIYRLSPGLVSKNFVRGYLYGYNRYAPFLQRNVAWILAVSVLFSLVLSAMQVGTGLDSLKDNPPFNKASFGFVIFSCVLVSALFAFVIMTFGFIFLFNMKEAILHSISERKRRKGLATKEKAHP